MKRLRSCRALKALKLFVTASSLRARLDVRTKRLRDLETLLLPPHLLLTISTYAIEAREKVDSPQWNTQKALDRKIAAETPLDLNDPSFIRFH